METLRLEMPSIPEIRRLQPDSIDKFLICDIWGLVEAAKRHRVESSYIDTLVKGSPELTDLATQYLDKFSSDIFLGQGFQTRDSVVGAVPNIPAYLSGSPFNMRCKTRTRNNMAPLSVFLELTGSAGTYDTRSGRGAAMLALVQLLANTRPVDFYTCTTFGGAGLLKMVACRIDTTPLDVGRAATLLCHNDGLNLTHLVCIREFGDPNRHSWSYGHPDLERKWSGEIIRRVLNPASSILFIPAAYAGDASLADHESWIREMLAKYGGEAMPE